MKGKYKTISLDRILDPEAPLRSDLSQDSVKELTSSIKQIGIINPLIVKKSGDNYEIVAGHRRLVSAGIAGLTDAPCIVIKAKGMTGEVIKLQENLIRDNINPIDWAHHLAHLKQQYNLENANIAKMLGMSESWVGQHLQILDYPEPLLNALQTETMSFSSARELVQIKDPAKRDLYIKHAVRGGITPALASRWKKQANQEPVNESQKTQTNDDKPPENPEPTVLPECPICMEVIKPEDELRLTVHAHCGPQTTSN